MKEEHKKKDAFWFVEEATEAEKKAIMDKMAKDSGKEMAEIIRKYKEESDE